MKDNLTLSEVRQALRDPNTADPAAWRAIEHDMLRQLAILHVDAECALDHPDPFHRDYRPILAEYLARSARIHGRTTAQQLVWCIEHRDPRVIALALRAWGLAL